MFLKNVLFLQYTLTGVPLRTKPDKTYFIMKDMTTGEKRVAGGLRILSFIVMLWGGVASCVDIPEAKRTSYETIVIQPRSVEIPIRYSATLEGSKEVTITPQTSGNVTEVLTEIGDRVKSGQVLFRIDSRQAQAAVDNAEANVQAAKAAMNTAELEMRSNKNLFDKGIVSSYVYETAKNTYDQTVAAVAQAEAALKNARLGLNYCTVTSPINGIVGSRSIELGELVQPGTVMARVSESSTMKAKFSASEDKFMEIKQENQGKSFEQAIKDMPPVSLELKNGTMYEHKGRLVRTSGVLDTQTGSIAAEAEFPNPDGLLTSGNIGTVIFQYQVDDAIIVPSSAIVRQLDKVVVWMVGTDSCAHSTSVEIYDLGQQVAILNGLKKGDVIVANGAANVIDGQKVLFK